MDVVVVGGAAAVPRQPPGSMLVADLIRHSRCLINSVTRCFSRDEILCIQLNTSLIRLLSVSVQLFLIPSSVKLNNSVSLWRKKAEGNFYRVSVIVIVVVVNIVGEEIGCSIKESLIEESDWIVGIVQTMKVYPRVFEIIRISNKPINRR